MSADATHLFSSIMHSCVIMGLVREIVIMGLVREIVIMGLVREIVIYVYMTKEMGLVDCSPAFL